MGTYELLLVLIISLVYLAIPVITLFIVIQSNKKISRIERDLNQVLKAE
jgi:hypothetical protein